MEVKYFRLIKTIAEEGNIANSSERLFLFLTQSALSHQLKELEEQLGFKVFHRSRNKWNLTEEGVALHKLAEDVLSTIEQGFSDIQQIRSGSKGSIKLSTECYSFYQGLSGFIQKMGMLYPDIEVEMNLEATLQPISKLLSNAIDIAIVTVKPASDLLSSYEVFEDEIFVLMHKEHPLSKAEYIDAGDFSDLHLIIHSLPMESVSVHEHFLKPNNVTPIKISPVPFTEVSLEMVDANMGVMCVPKRALKAFKVSEDLVYKKIGKYGLRRTHYLVVRKADETKKYINDFISNFEEDVSMVNEG